MTSTTFSSLALRHRALLILLAVLPLLILLAARQFGLMSLLRLAVAGGVGIAFLTAVYARPVWGVLFMTFYVYSGLFFYIPTVITYGVMAVLIVVAGLEILSGQRDRLVDPMFWGSAAIFTMFSLQSTLVAHFPALTLFQLTFFAKVMALTLLIVHFVRTRTELVWLVTAIFVGAIATIVFGAINLKLGVYTEENVIRGIGIFRFSGTHGDPNDAAGIMCSAIPAGVYLVRFARRRWVRWAAALGIIVLVVGMFSTFSRAAILALGVVGIAVVGREVRTRGGWMITLGVVVLALLLAPGYYWARLIELREILNSNFRQDFSAMLRFDAMTTAWKLFLENPWAGIGLGNFSERGATGVISRIVVHNAYLEVLVSVGIIGLAAFVGIFASGLRCCVNAVRDASLSPDDRSLAYYIGVSQLSILISSTFLSFQFKYPLWIPLAAALALGNIVATRR